MPATAIKAAILGLLPLSFPAAPADRARVGRNAAGT
jgi:hypothetical protein